MPERVGMNDFAKTDTFGGISAGVPNHFVTDGVVRGVMHPSREQPYLRFAFQAPVMLAEFLVERGAERNLAVLASFPFANVNTHHGFVDVSDLKVGDLGAPCAGAIGGHQQRAVEEAIGGID